MLKVEAVDQDRGINDNMTYVISSEDKGGPWGGWGAEGAGAPSELLQAAAPTVSCQTPRGLAGSPSGQTG